MNKKTLAIILSIALAIGAFAGLSLLSANAVTYVGDGNEFVVNGDASDLFGLTTSSTVKFETSGGGASVTAVDFNDAAEGKTSNGKAIKVVDRNDTINGNRGKYGSVSTLITDGGEGKYIASVWVKVPDATQAVKIAFGFGTEGTMGTREQFTVQPNTWTKLEVVQDVATGMIQFGLFETGNTKGIDIYVDDMSIQKAIVPEAKPVYVGDGNELVVNGNAGDGSYTKIFGIVDSNSGLGTSGGAAVSIVADNDAADGKVSNGKVVKATKRTNRDTGNRGHITITDLITKQGAGKYIASVWVKVPDATEAVTIGFGFGAGTVGSREIFTVQPNTWTKLEVVYDVTTEQYIGLYDTTRDANNTTDSCNFVIYYDDLSIQKAIDPSTVVTTPTPTGDGYEFVINGNASAMFELLDSKATFATSGGGASVTVVDFDDAAEGKTSNGKAIKVVDRNDTIKGNRGKFDWVDEIFKAKGEGKYIASVWVKIPSATGPVRVAFGFGSDYTAGNRQKFTIQPDTWTKLTVVQDLTSDMTQFGLFETGDTRGIDIYIDDLSIQKVGTPSGNNGNSGNAGSSSTGDIVPVGLIAIAIISASALVIVARRKRED